MRATAKGHREIVELLLKMCASLEEENSDGCTPLMLACTTGRTVCNLSSLIAFLASAYGFLAGSGSGLASKWCPR